MKLFFESKNCIFVLGFDPSIVAKSIQRESHGMIPDGLVYLRKIIQAEYRLPQSPDAKLLSLLNGYQTKSHLQHEFDIIDQQLRTDPTVPSDYQERILKSTHRSPRQMKRLINELALKLPQIKEKDYASVFTWTLFQFRWPEPYATFIEATEKKPTKEVVLRLRHAANVPLDQVEQGAADAVVSAEVGA
jgi:hypothetical protein